MRISFTRNAEKERQEKNKIRRETKPKWEYFSSESLVEVVHAAKDMGWKDNQVQVRKSGTFYIIEPYEEGCGCRGLLKYKDFFD
jgi:hypothetical protein